MATKKILITDPVDAVCGDILRKAGLEVDQVKWTKEELLANIKNYHGLIVRSETKVTPDVLEAGTNLAIVGRAGTGVDNVDCPTATARGVLVMNTPGGNTMSAAEMTCALISSMARHIPQACASLKQGAWDRKLYSGSELYGKTLAILGLGRIGKEVALRMQACGMTTIGFDPIIPAEETAKFGVTSMTLEQIWPQADFITVHTPLIPQTKNLINDAVFAKCKKGVRVVNVARGGIIDEEALLRNLKSGQCGGAALDVFIEEPPKSEYYKELLAHPKVVCTPHLGASTSEAQLRVAEEIAEQIVDYFNGTGLVGAINAGDMVTAMNPENRPWLNAATGLGKMAAAFGPVKSLEVSLVGSKLTNTNFIGTAAVAGYLIGTTGNKNINLINCPAMAKEKGISHTVSTKAECPKYCSHIHVAVGSVHLHGSVRGQLPVMDNIGESKFPGGVLLCGKLALVDGSKGAGAIIDDFGKKNINVAAMFMTADKKWVVIRVQDDADPTGITGVKMVANF